MIDRSPLVSRVVRAQIARAVTAIVHRERVPQANLDVVFVRKSESHSLNARFRGKRRVADVLSFPMASGWKLGEVIVSPEFAREMAVRHRKKFEDVLLRWVVHGAYHLLGYDHESDPDFEQMVEQERQVIHSMHRGFVEL